MDYDIIVIGGGPAGYSASIYASMNGLKTLMVEKELLGGTCLNWGCIPTKAILKSADVYSKIKHAKNYGIEVSDFSYDYKSIKERKNKIVEGSRKGLKQLLKYKKVEVINGYAKVVSENEVKIKTEEEEIIKTAKNIIIASGSKEPQIPFFQIDHKMIVDSKDALDLETLPENIAIIGGGVIGCEFATIFSSFGKNVTVIEMMKKIVPFEDSAISKYLQMYMKKKKIKILTGKKVVNIEKQENSVNIGLDDEKVINADLVLVSVGRDINSENIFENVAIELDKKAIKIDDNMRTSVSNIFAIGDVTGKKMLAHTGYVQAEVAVNTILGKESHINYDQIPSAIFTSPEIGSVGMSEDRAKELEIDYITGKFPLSACGKASAISETDGMIKTVIEKSSGKILGVHMIGSSATEVLTAASIAVQKELTVEDFKHMVFAHPTIAEELKESALSAYKKATHIL